MNTRDTILVVDDMEVNRAILRGLFEQDYNLLEAENGEQALVLLEQCHGRIAAVLLDLVMPVMDGYETMEALRGKGLLSEFPVVVITAEGSADNEVKAFDLGASDIVMKPFEPYVVKRRIQNIIELNLRKLYQEELIAEQSAKLRESNAVMVDALSSIIEYRSVETGQHIQRIRLFTKILLEDVARSCPEYGLDERTIDVIASASSMHDIGKIAISDSILNKPGRLTEAEFQIMKTHTVKGCEMLSNLDRMSDKEYLQYAYNICRYHHERWDGRGYPDGLKGDGIPICAQVVGVADCYDALTTDRVYKKAIPPDEACNMILNGECGMFSPRLLECLKNVQSAFAALSKAYADGRSSKESAVYPALSVPQYDDTMNTLQIGQLKYFTLLKYVHSTVIEVDFSTGLYHMVYMQSRDFELLKSGTRFEESIRRFVESAVHPDDREQVLEILGPYTNELFENGLMRKSRTYRIYSQADRGYRSCLATILRVDTGNPHQKKAMIIWQELDGDGHAPCAAMRDTTVLYNDADVSSLLGGIQVCLNDDEYTLLNWNDGLRSLLGYSDEDIKERFDNKYLNIIYPADRERTLAEIKRQQQTGNTMELEYRMVAKDGHIVWVLDKCQLMGLEDGRECVLCVLVDITRSKKAQDELRLSLERHKIIMDQANDIIFEWDIHADEITYSSNFEKKFGYKPVSKEMRARLPQVSHIHPDDLAAFMALMNDMAAGMTYKEVEFRLADADGRYTWCKMRAAAQFDDLGKVYKAVGVMTDIDADKRASQALRYQAERDELTQLYNKRASRRLAEAYLARRTGASQGALLLIDVDDFKQINDQYGHMFGDVALQEIAGALRKLFGSDTILARIGGDEFMVVIPNITDIDTVERQAAKIGEAFRYVFEDKDVSCRPSCSIGVAICPKDGADFDTLFQHSDLALYGAKDKGKNCYLLYDPSMDRPFGLSDVRLTTNTRIESDSPPSVILDSLIQQALFNLYASDNTEAAIQSILDMIGRQFGVSRAYIFEDTADGLHYSNTFEWCGEGVESQMDALQNGVYAEIGGRPSYIELFNDEGVFYCQDIQRLPDAIRGFFSAQNIQSILQCAIRDSEGWYGFVGFDDCRSTRLWTREQVDSLTFMSRLLGAFLIKKRVQERSQQTVEDLRMVLDHQNAWVYVLEPETYKLRYINAKTRSIAPDAQMGMRCYEAFFHRDSPCETCPLRSQGVALEIHNPLLRVWSLADAVPIQWDNEESFLVTCQDITAYKTEREG